MQIDPIRGRLEYMRQEEWEEYSKECRSYQIALFYPAENWEGLWRLALANGTFHVRWNDLVMLRSLGGNLLKDLEQNISANKVKRPCQVNKSQIQRLVLLSAIFLELSHRTDHVNSLSSRSISHRDSGYTCSDYTCNGVSKYLAKSFPTMLSRDIPR